MLLLTKQLQSYENEIKSIKNLIKLDKQYYETKKQENLLWAKSCNTKLFKKYMAKIIK